MADTTSPATGRRYGVARVCRVWEVARSSFYAVRQAGADDAGARSSPARRGPRPAISDQDLLTAIRADLARSPWNGEGHRKVWARLRAMDGIRVSRRRVLRLMREHAPLSPRRT
jgi:putative transposase